MLLQTNFIIRKNASENLIHLQKALPPFGEKTDQDALLQGILTGSIDCISNGHQPYSFQDKARVRFGTSGYFGLRKCIFTNI